VVRAYRLPEQCASFLSLRFFVSPWGLISYISVMIDTILFLFLLVLRLIQQPHFSTLSNYDNERMLSRMNGVVVTVPTRKCKKVAYP
jgi:hypothetical protein